MSSREESASKDVESRGAFTMQAMHQQFEQLNLLTSHFLVKIGFLDRNLFRMFGGTNEVGFRHALAHFKALEVSYNIPRNSFLQKM